MALPRNIFSFGLAAGWLVESFLAGRLGFAFLGGFALGRDAELIAATLAPDLLPLDFRWAF
jgi:hypothetical protein